MQASTFAVCAPWVSAGSVEEAGCCDRWTGCGVAGSAPVSVRTLDAGRRRPALLNIGMAVFMRATREHWDLGVRCRVLSVTRWKSRLLSVDHLICIYVLPSSASFCLSLPFSTLLHRSCHRVVCRRHMRCRSHLGQTDSF